MTNQFPPMHLRSLSVAFPMLMLGALVPAQVTDGYWRPIPFTSQLPQGTLATDTVAGNFTGHGYPDLAFRLGDQIALCTAPAVHTATDPIVSLAANGLATLRQGGTGGRDALLIATSAGLVRWEIAPQDTQLTTTLDTGNWQSVCVGDLDGAAPDDIIGVSGAARDRLRVLRRSYAAGGGAVPTTVVQELPFPGQSIHQVVLAQWNDVGPWEVCVATNQRLWIGNLTQVLRQSPLDNIGPSFLTRVYMQMSQRDSLAWLVTPVGGVRELRTYGRLGSAISQPDLQGEVLHISAGDLDGNGADDLAITLQQSSVIKVLTNSSSGTVAAFDYPAVDVGAPFTGSASVACGASWLGDLNADGACDLVGMWRTGTAPHVSGVAWVFRSIPFGLAPRPVLDQPSVETDGTSVLFRVRIVDDVAYRVPDATHLELLAWETKPTEPTMVMMPVGRYRVRVPVATALEATFTTPLANGMDRSHVGIVRWIKIVDGKVERIWQPTHFSIALGSSQPQLLTSWLLGSLQQHPIPPALLYVPGMTTNHYLMRALVPELVPPGWEASTSSDEGGTGNLPPPPPWPPKPPTPPPGG